MDRRRGSSIAGAIALAALAASVAAAPGTGAAPPPPAGTFAPAADAYVTDADPRRNFGAANRLRVDGSPRMRAHLRFEPSGLTGTVRRATLRVLATSRSRRPLTVRAVANTTWGERKITGVTAPAVAGAVTASSPSSFAAGTWLSLDVTPLVRGNGPVSLALVTSSGTQIALASREAGAASRPRLVVETVPAGEPAPGPQPQPQPEPQPQPAPGPDADGVVRAAFYYPWFPEAWSQRGITPFARHAPSAGRYSSADPAVIAGHIRSMQYATIEAGIASWWGAGHRTDQRVQALLAAAGGTGFRWALYHEGEGQGDPTVEQIRADLVHIRDRYARHPAYLRRDGRFVVFVYAQAADGCRMAERWQEANTAGAYLVLKVFPGHRACPAQPDGWHQYAPAVAADHQAGRSFAISPGFFHAAEPERLPRDLGRWRRDARAMVRSGEPWQLVTTFNEWGEGTAVESAREWQSPSGHGLYLDVLREEALAAGAPAPPPPAGGAVRIAAAGDIACAPDASNATGARPHSCQHRQVSDLLVGAGYSAVLTLGDTQYERAAYQDLVASYHPTWGRLKAITRPVVGNHEYLTPGAEGYFRYFGPAAGDPGQGWYSYQAGAWHVVALNSNCSKVGGCGAGSPQERWLRADLAAHPARCTLAYWHHPRYSSGQHGGHASMKAIWQALKEAGAEVVLSGHDHHYERFAPQDADGRADPHGLRQFVVGTGGKNHYPAGAPVANSEVTNGDTFGVLEMTLREGGYDWRFRPSGGGTFTDAGSAACR